MTRRPPAVSGSFYEGSADRLRAQLERCFAANPPAAEKLKAIGGIVPHAGLMYSGHVAAAFYGRVELQARLIILCPNHTGLGAPAAINREGTWFTPLGDLEIDTELADAIMAGAPGLEVDDRAHLREHSLEVQLPFIQYLNPATRFVPICLGVPDFALCQQIGLAIAAAVKSSGGSASVGLLSSSDLNHYKDQQTTLRKDQMAIDAMLELDARKLWETVLREDISMCGFIPTTATLIATQVLGASSAELLKHATSGDINRDYSAVVGYASIVIR